MSKSRRLRRTSSTISPLADRQLGDLNKTKRRASIATLPHRPKSKKPSKDYAMTIDEEARNLEKEGSLAWKILSNSQTQALQEMTVEDVEKKLAIILELTNSSTEPQDAILLDYYTVGFWWAKEEGFTSQQLSAFITVLNRLLENIKDKNYSLSENISDLKSMMVGIGAGSVEASGGLDFLDVEQAIKISDYIKSSLFQHHRMYEFMFHGQRKEEIIGTELCVETLPAANIPFPAPLDEGLVEDTYNEYIAPPEAFDESENEELSKSATPNEEQLTEQKDEEVLKVQVEVDPLNDVTADDVKRMFDIVSAEMFGNLQIDVTRKLREREVEIITRINKIHKVAETT